MKRWSGMLVILLSLAACDGATNNLYGGSGSNNSGFTNTTPPWHVTYAVDAVHDGSPPTDSMTYDDGATVTVLPQGNLTWEPFPFTGWTTKDPGYNGIGDNGGTHYNAGEQFEIHSNVTLWAAWANP